MLRSFTEPSSHRPSLSRYRLFLRKFFHFINTLPRAFIFLISSLLITPAVSLHGQVETYAYGSPEIIEVNSMSRDAFQQLDIGDYDGALVQFNQILESKPDYTSALMGRAKCLFELGQYLDAFDSYLKVVNKDARDVYALEGLGNSALYLNQFDQALNYYHKAISIYPENSTVYHSMAVALICQKNYEKATEYLKTAILMYNKRGLDAPYSLLLSYVCYAQSKSQVRINELLRYIKSFNFSPTDGWVTDLLRYIQGDIESTTLLAKVVSREQEVEAHTYIGFKLLFLGDKERSEQHLKWVRSIEDYHSIETIIANNIALEPKA